MRNSRPPLALVALAALAASLQPAAADPVEELTAGWYTVEAIVFQRTGVTDTDTAEQLVEFAPRSVSAGIRSLDAYAETNRYNLGPLALATLEFPTLSYDCAAAGEARPFRPPVVPAWYQPDFPDVGAPLDTPDTGVQPDLPGTSAHDFGAATGPGNYTCFEAPLESEDTIDSEASTGSDIAPRSETVTGTESASGGACPPVPLDIPLAPGQAIPLCSLPPGQPPPHIEPELESHPLLDWLSAARRFETGLRQQSYQLGTSDARLRREANRIRRAGDLRLLWHGRWTQPVPQRDSPEPLLVQAGRRAGGVHELEGTFDVTLGRYLHFHARLWWVSPPISRNTQAGNAVGNPFEGAVGNTLRDHVGDPTSVKDGPGTGLESRLGPGRIPHMVLDESRVMRSGTLHYLDHPVLGVLVRAEPVDPPDWLVDASAALVSAEGTY